MRELPRITNVWLNVTERCNLACKYCFVKQQPLDMDFDTAKKAVDIVATNALADKKTPSLVFFGGEPMLRWDEVVKPIIHYIRDTYGSFDMSITTNGLLLTDDIIDFFANENISVLLSFDGEKETQDSQRVYHDGSGTFDQTVEIAKKLLTRFPNMTFRATISPWNADKLYNNFKFAQSIGYQNAFFIPDAFATWSEEEVASLERGVAAIASDDGQMIFTPFDKIKRKVPDSCVDMLYGQCGIGCNSSMAVGASGRFWTCQELTESDDRFIIGDVENGISDELRMKVFSGINLENRTSSKKDLCDDCAIKTKCNGGCLINNYLGCGSAEVQPEIICRWNQMLNKYGGGE